MDIMRTHPMVIIGGILQENPFFVPPDEMLRELRERAGRAGTAQALADHLLALRALLEPEGAQSSVLGRRLAALCAVPAERDALAARVEHAAALERSVVAGAAPGEPLGRLAAELSGHLRALLRDVLCGHLEADLRGLADALLAHDAEQAGAEPEAVP